MRTHSANAPVPTPHHGKSRKEMRREKKEAKKERIRHHFKNNPQPQASTTSKSKPINKKNHHIEPPKAQKSLKERKEKKQIKQKQAENNQDDKIIQMYESKLGIKAGKDKYGKIAKNYGFDDDLFDFLDGITKKVTSSAPPQENNQDEEENMIEQDQEQEEQMQEEEDQEMKGEEMEGDFDAEYDRMFDNLDQQQFDEEGQDDEEGELDQDEQQSKQLDEEDDQGQQKQKVQEQEQEEEEHQHHKQAIEQKKSAPSPAVYRSPFQKNNEAAPSQQQKETKRNMNSLFNKLSDGNILLTFREFVSIIESHSRSLTIPIFSQLFTRFNLLTEKPLFHILATNVALAAALHYAFGNRLMAPLLYSLTTKFLALFSEKQDDEEVREFGYSKRAQRLKNYATMVSLFYNYSSITGEFLQSFVAWLSSSLDRYTIELLYIVVQKCGVRVRQNDPSVLKNIIATVKEAISRYRVEHPGAEELQKVNFIEAELTEIKFNKKVQANADQRMAFLETFITKNVPKEIQNQKETLLLKFQEVAKADTSRTNWWQREEGFAVAQNEEGQGQGAGQFEEIAGQKKRLLELAKSFHMVTEIKKNIFLCLMDSKDYLQATQRILDLRIKNFQDVATVLVQVCTLEPNFNPYYPLVAAKLASVMPKFRLNLQYAIWDHLKLIHQYQLRRTANLAKFAAKLISDPLSNSSLSVLKFYPDLSNIRAIDTTFLSIFFGYFFKKVKREYLSKLVAKLREDNNRSVKEGIKEYLSQFEPEESVKEKVKLCRRLLILELDERKMERGDDQ